MNDRKVKKFLKRGFMQRKELLYMKRSWLKKTKQQRSNIYTTGVFIGEKSKNWDRTNIKIFN